MWMQVYLDVGVCRQGVQQNRTMGDKAFCSDPEQLGRIVIGAASPPQEISLHLDVRIPFAGAAYF